MIGERVDQHGRADTGDEQRHQQCQRGESEHDLQPDGRCPGEGLDRRVAAGGAVPAGGVEQGRQPDHQPTERGRRRDGREQEGGPAQPAGQRGQDRGEDQVGDYGGEHAALRSRPLPESPVGLAIRSVPPARVELSRRACCPPPAAGRPSGRPAKCRARSHADGRDETHPDGRAGCAGRRGATAPAGRAGRRTGGPPAVPGPIAAVAPRPPTHCRRPRHGGGTPDRLGGRGERESRATILTQRHEWQVRAGVPKAPRPHSPALSDRTWPNVPRSQVTVRSGARVTSRDVRGWPAARRWPH